MINLCLVVIATQFSETKQREHRLMLEQRQRYLSSSTVASYAEPGDCYEEIFQYVCHILRKAKRRALGLYQALQSRRQALGPGVPTSTKPGPQAKEPRHFSKWLCLPWPPGGPMWASNWGVPMTLFARVSTCLPSISRAAQPSRLRTQVSPEGSSPHPLFPPCFSTTASTWPGLALGSGDPARPWRSSLPAWHVLMDSGSAPGPTLERHE